MWAACQKSQQSATQTPVVLCPPSPGMVTPKVAQQCCTAAQTISCCRIQGRASDVVVWKANQQYPIAVLHQKHGVTVPAVAIERSPWGQQPQAEAVRLVSCSDTGKACPPLLLSLPLLLPSVPPFPQAPPWHVFFSAYLPTLPCFFLVFLDFIHFQLKTRQLVCSI